MQPNQSQYQNLGIHIKAKDIRLSHSFYSSLGFEPVFAYGTDTFLSQLPESIKKANEKYNGIVYSVGQALLEVADGHMAVKPGIFREHISSSKVSAMIYVSSVDTLVKRTQENGIGIAVPVREFPWGTREVVIIDPDGFVLVFIESKHT